VCQCYEAVKKCFLLNKLWMGWTEANVLNIMEKYHKIEFLKVIVPDSLCAAVKGNILLFFETTRNQVKLHMFTANKLKHVWLWRKKLTEL
jgi:hypothetical protein